MRAENDRLSTGGHERDDSRPPDLAPGTRRRRDRHDRRNVGPDKVSSVDGIVVVSKRPIMRDLECNELARVERRAPSHCDDGSRPVRTVGSDTVDHVFLDRIWIDRVEYRGGDAALFEEATDTLGDAHLDDTRVADDEHARRAETPRVIRQGAESANAEDD